MDVALGDRLVPFLCHMCGGNVVKLFTCKPRLLKSSSMRLDMSTFVGRGANLIESYFSSRSSHQPRQPLAQPPFSYSAQISYIQLG